jgi:integrase
MSQKGVVYVAPQASSLPDLQDGADFDATPALTQFAAEVGQWAVANNWKERPGTGALESPMQVLFATLMAQYQNDLNVLVQRSQTIGENARLSKAINEVFARRKWRVATSRKYATTLKRILNLLAFPAGFVESLRLAQLPKSGNGNNAIGKYGTLPPDHDVRVRLEGWVDKIKTGTRNNSELSIRGIINFYTSTCLPAFGLDLDAWPDDAPLRVRAQLAKQPQLLADIIGDGATASAKAIRLQFLLGDILGIEDVEVPAPKKRKCVDDDEDDDGSDVHRISAEHLDLIHTEAQKSPMDELLFMLAITTGLRVGGMAKIHIRNVAEVKNGQYKVKQEGKTKEKGNKFARFVLCSSVQQLMGQWLSQHRPADEGPYLFPGAIPGSHISTDCLRTRFRRLCNAAGIEGKECHPHALRHTHAHILLECGNSVEAVSKCLNHSNTSVTEQFYLRESAVQLQSRCKVPWARTETEAEKQQRSMNALPAFLKAEHDPPKAPPSSQDTARLERKRARKEQGRAAMRAFADATASLHAPAP